MAREAPQHDEIALHRAPLAHPPGRRGVTLLELLLALAIAALVITLAVPAVGGWAARHRVQAAAAELHQHLAAARNEAVLREADVRVCPGQPPEGCLDPPAWERGWFQFADADADGAWSEPETILAVHPPLPDVVGAGTSGRPSIRFNALGAAPAANATVTFCDAAGITPRVEQVRVSNSGRIRRTTDEAAAGSGCDRN